MSIGVGGEGRSLKKRLVGKVMAWGKCEDEFGTRREMKSLHTGRMAGRVGET